MKFANIEEDTPSYHRRYDFFVSKFSSMCHNCVVDPDVRARLVSVELTKATHGVNMGKINCRCNQDGYSVLCVM